MFFITVPEGAKENEDSTCFSKALKGLIQILYIPAIRKPSDQIRYVSGSILYRVLRLLTFDDDPLRWLTNVYKRIDEHNIQDLEELLPAKDQQFKYV